MAEMEKRIASASRGGGPPPPPGARGGPGMDQALQKKMEELEAKMSGGAFADQMAAMEKRIKETEERLAKERQTTSLLHGILHRGIYSFSSILPSPLLPSGRLGTGDCLLFSIESLPFVQLQPGRSPQ